MKYSRRRLDYVADSRVTHPMLLHGAGAVTVIAACSTAANALSLSMVMLALCTVSAGIYIFERGEYIQPMRTIIYFVPSAVVVFLCGMALNSISPSTLESLGGYLPLLAGDALALALLDDDAPFIPAGRILPAALRLWWLYFAMAMPIGILRELSGLGSVFGLAVSSSALTESAAAPFAGFIMLGFGLALVQRLQEN